MESLLTHFLLSLHIHKPCWLYFKIFPGPKHSWPPPSLPPSFTWNMAVASEHVSLLLVLLLFILSPYGNQSEPAKRQDGACPLHCSKPSKAPNYMSKNQHPYNGLQGPPPPVHLSPYPQHLSDLILRIPPYSDPSSQGPLAGLQTHQGWSSFRAVEFGIPSAWNTMSPFSHMAPSLTSFRSSSEDLNGRLLWGPKLKTATPATTHTPLPCFIVISYVFYLVVLFICLSPLTYPQGQGFLPFLCTMYVPRV